MAKKKSASKRAKAKDQPSKPPKPRTSKAPGAEGVTDAAGAKSDCMDSTGGKKLAMDQVRASVRHIADDIENGDWLEAKKSLEVLVGNGACEGWLFDDPSDFQSFLFHLMIGLHDAAFGIHNAHVQNLRSPDGAQECLLEMMLFFFQSNPVKPSASKWLLDLLKLPHFKKAWARRIWQVKAPKLEKLRFTLDCLREFDDQLVTLVDSLLEFDRIQQTQSYLPLASTAEKLQAIRGSQPELANALEAVLQVIYSTLPIEVMAFEKYLSQDLAAFIRVVMPFLKARWQALPVAKRKVICGSTAKGQQSWGKVDDHIEKAARAVVLCALARDEPITSVNIKMLEAFVKPKREFWGTAL